MRPELGRQIGRLGGFVVGRADEEHRSDERAGRAIGEIVWMLSLFIDPTPRFTYLGSSWHG